MARAVTLQGYHFYACDACDFAYKDAAAADECAAFDRTQGMRSAEITKDSIAPPARHYQAVLKFIEEEQKAAKKAAAPKPAAPAAPGAPAAKPALSPEELEARKKAALEKAAAMKAASEQAKA